MALSVGLRLSPGGPVTFGFWRTLLEQDERDHIIFRTEPAPSSTRTLP